MNGEYRSAWLRDRRAATDRYAAKSSNSPANVPRMGAITKVITAEITAATAAGTHDEQAESAGMRASGWSARGFQRGSPARAG